MAKFNLLLLPLLTLLCQSSFAQPAHPVPARIEVFTNTGILLTGTEGTRIYYLDGLAQLENQLSQGLPAEPQQAAQQAQQRAKSLGPALQQRAMNAAEGIAKAARYGVNRVPAIVFNGQAIVYGVTDLNKARQLFQQSNRITSGTVR